MTTLSSQEAYVKEGLTQPASLSLGVIYVVASPIQFEWVPFEGQYCVSQDDSTAFFAYNSSGGSMMIGDDPFDGILTLDQYHKLADIADDVFNNILLDA